MTAGTEGGEQLALVEAGQAPEAGREGAVALVLVDTPLAHLDRPFEYSVPERWEAVAVPGARVKVRFAGKDLDGYILDRRDRQEHPGRLTPVRRVVSPEPVLTAELARVCRALADHYAGTMADMVRLAIPPRHARAEAQVPPAGDQPASAVQASSGGELPAPGTSAWKPYPAGAALLRRLAQGQAPAAAWTALPDAGAASGWPQAVAEAVAATGRSGRGSIVVVPDHRDVDRVGAALEAVLGPGQHVRLTADQGPQQRYADWLRVLRGHVRVAIGSRSAAFAPVRDLGLVVWWDDGDDLHQEPRAPYPHVREVLRERATVAAAGLLVGGYSRTTQVQLGVVQGWLRDVAAAPGTVRTRAPRVVVAGEGHQGRTDPAADRARIPTVAWRAIKEALPRGPVLVQVPRGGYVVGLACQDCRATIRCPQCHGPMAQPGPDRPAACRWCGHVDAGTGCPGCGSSVRRSTVVGQRRTAEEIGRAFPGVPVKSSHAGQVLAAVPGTPALVVATPGAEPVAEGGYAAVLLVDGWALLERAGLDGPLEAFRRWAAAAALTRPAGADGVVVVAGVPGHAGLRPVEALVRWDPVWLAVAELAERVELGLPPAARAAVLSGPLPVIEGAAAELAEDPRLTASGPVPTHAEAEGSAPAYLVVRPAAGEGSDLAATLRAWRSARSARKADGAVRLQLDPGDLAGRG